jgi:aquaporin Z
MNKYIVEFIGTFFLVLTIGCCVVIGGTAGVIAPLAIGSSLMVMIYAGGHISGGHYNPAVTLGVWIRGRCATNDVVPYWISQLVGAGLAAAALTYLKGDISVSPIVVKTGPALLAEFLYTFALVYVVLNSATAKATANNSFYGLAIGFTVLAGAFSVGKISGAAFNPAVAIGASIMGLSAWPNIWIYLVSDLAGGLVAGLTFKYLNPQDK